MDLNHKCAPSCLQTTFPQDKQLLIRSCLVAWQLQIWRPSTWTEFFVVSTCEEVIFPFFDFVGWFLVRGISSLNWQWPSCFGIFPGFLMNYNTTYYYLISKQYQIVFSLIRIVHNIILANLPPWYRMRLPAFYVGL